MLHMLKEIHKNQQENKVYKSRCPQHKVPVHIHKRSIKRPLIGHIICWQLGMEYQNVSAICQYYSCNIHTHMHSEILNI